MNAAVPLLIVLGLASVAEDPNPAPDPSRVVFAAVVEAAEENAARGKDRLTGDALGDYYVRRAAAAARDARASPKAFLIGLGLALNTSDQFSRLGGLVNGLLVAQETKEERKHRLDVMGQPTLRGRSDWLIHFALSATLTARLGGPAAEHLGLSKELVDARPGGSGFSFGDLAADYAGVAFARWLLGEDGERRLKTVAEGFAGTDYLPKIADLEEGLSADKLTEKYGKADDPRFVKQCDAIRDRIGKADGYPRTRE